MPRNFRGRGGFNAPTPHERLATRPRRNGRGQPLTGNHFARLFEEGNEEQENVAPGAFENEGDQLIAPTDTVETPQPTTIEQNGGNGWTVLPARQPAHTGTNLLRVDYAPPPQRGTMLGTGIPPGAWRAHGQGTGLHRRRFTLTGTEHGNVYLVGSNFVPGTVIFHPSTTEVEYVPPNQKTSTQVFQSPADRKWHLQKGRWAVVMAVHGRHWEGIPLYTFGGHGLEGFSDELKSEFTGIAPFGMDVTAYQRQNGNEPVELKSMTGRRVDFVFEGKEVIHFTEGRSCNLEDTMVEIFGHLKEPGLECLKRLRREAGCC